MGNISQHSVYSAAVGRIVSYSCWSDQLGRNRGLLDLSLAANLCVPFLSTQDTLQQLITLALATVRLKVNRYMVYILVFLCCTKPLALQSNWCSNDGGLAEEDEQLWLTHSVHFRNAFPELKVESRARLDFSSSTIALQSSKEPQHLRGR